ncbi:MAG: hypothetical protein HQL32_13365 [Planctomycetes bacterium]|nr:hypothetical protein [Planctomycetota bacterium]
MKHLISLLCILYCSTLALQATDISNTLLEKNINIYGPIYKEGKIIHSEKEGSFVFSFSGEADSKQPYGKVIQIYTPLWKLKPGKYSMTIELKSTTDSVGIPLQLTGKDNSGEDPKELTSYYCPEIGTTWKPYSLTVDISKNVIHGYLLLRVGNVPKNCEISLKPTITFSKI